MRKEAEIRAELESARAAYQAEANTAPAARAHELGGRVRALQAELAAALAEGAQPCAGCGSLPHGMLRSEASGRVPAIYEVGCLRCGTEGAPVAARGLTPAAAVAAWNASEFV